MKKVILDSLVKTKCCDYRDLLPRLKSNSIDCIITDPPYAIGFDGKRNPSKNWDNISLDDYKDMLNFLFKEGYRILKPHGTLWMFFSHLRIKQVLSCAWKSRLDVNLENWSIYARNKGRSASTKLKSLREDILHLSKGKYNWYQTEYLREVVAPYVLNGKPRGWFVDSNTGQRVRWTGLGNVLCFSPPTHNSRFEKPLHSTQKPVLLNVMLMMCSTEKGATILDPFMGSGSTAVSSIMCGRNFIGCELSQEMYDKATNWIQNIDLKEIPNYINHVKGNLFRFSI